MTADQWKAIGILVGYSVGYSVLVALLACAIIWLANGRKGVR